MPAPAACQWPRTWDPARLQGAYRRERPRPAAKHGYEGVIGRTLGEEVREIGPDFQTLGPLKKKQRQHGPCRRRPVTLKPQGFHAVPFDCRASRFSSCSLGSESLCLFAPNSTLHPRNLCLRSTIILIVHYMSYIAHANLFNYQDKIFSLFSTYVESVRFPYRS